MVYGYYDLVDRIHRRRTRLSSSAVLLCPRNISIADNCWIWHYSIIDGSCGVSIGEGVQIGAWVGIFTHSSHIAIRLYGPSYLNHDYSLRKGYIRGSVSIGDYTFVGAGAKIMPGVSVGKGCVISTLSVVTKNIPDYSIVAGNPARVIGNTRDMDAPFLADPEIARLYYEPSSSL
jgi:acetyltransferase-like isoleucine patch superfamily enzyme